MLFAMPGSLLLLVAGCTIEPPLERRNPYDPDGVYEFALTGPDSAHFVGEVLQFDLTSVPDLPPGDLIIHWEVFDELSDGLGRPIPSSLVNPGPNGTFVVRSTTARYRRQTAVAAFGEVQFGKSFFLGQKVTTMTLGCPHVAGPTDECPLPADSLGVSLTATMTDAADAAVGEIAHAFARATVTSRTPSVFSPTGVGTLQPNVRLTRVGTGSSWIVVAIDEAIDSIRVFVP
jgi:hypothetical protein